MIFSLFKKNRDDEKVPEARVIKAPSPASVPGGAGDSSSLPPDSQPPASVPSADAEPFTEGFTDFSLGGLAGSMELDEEADPLESLLEQGLGVQRRVATKKTATVKKAAVSKKPTSARKAPVVRSTPPARKYRDEPLF